MTEQKVERTVHDLRVLVSDLWDQRYAPSTADLVLRQEADLYIALGSLGELVKDVRAANDRRIETPSLAAAE